MALGLNAASRAKANAYLDDQRRMLHLQMEEMRAEEPYKLSHFRLRRFSDYAKAALEASIGLIALALVGVGAASVWNAARSDGMIIESFTVPPDMAVRGLTGEVVAGQLEDKLNTIQTSAGSASAQGRNVTGDRSDDIKVEIPETGISVGEAWRFLRRWLGHDTMIGGEVYRTAAGLAVRIRVGSDGTTITGPETDLDGLVQRAAEHVEAVMQPARYGAWLFSRDSPRNDEAQAILERTARDPAQTTYQRAASLNNLGLQYGRSRNDTRTEAVMLRRSMALQPGYPIAISNLAGAELDMGHAETALRLDREAATAMERHHDEFVPDAVAGVSALTRQTAAALTGDFAEAIRQFQSRADQMNLTTNRGDRLLRQGAEALARQHDGAAVRDWLRQMGPPPSKRDETLRSITQLRLAIARGDWQAVVASEPNVEKTIAAIPGFGDIPLITTNQLHPLLALAKVKIGDIAGGESLIAPTPGDCYDCVRIRGQIASEAQQWARADYWFARAVHDAPSIPFAYEDWGRTLLARGKSDDAIAQFTLANQKGPHFADALEGWGEALMAKSQSHLALAKFTEAEKYAPNWGRLQLKWGEALYYAGKKDEAAKHFARAATLDLTPSEKAELARQR
jgi:Tfp pilus assembly protein PilF